MLKPPHMHRNQSLTDRRDGCYNLAELEFVKDGGLSSGIETNLKYG
jgi:hypothetical protein